MNQQQKLAAKDRASLAAYLRKIQPSRAAKLTKTLNA
jgi:hypothetical protein